MDWLKNDLGEVFARRSLSERDTRTGFAYDHKRKQYLSTAILNAIQGQKKLPVKKESWGGGPRFICPGIKFCLRPSESKSCGHFPHPSEANILSST
jgi:hypothetical protein